MTVTWLRTSAIALGLGLCTSNCSSDGSGSHGSPADGGGGSGGSGGAGGSSGEVTFEPFGDVVFAASYPANGCVAEKQVDAARYCHDVLQAWARFEASGDAGDRDQRVEAARTELEEAWSAAEEAATSDGSDCADNALGASEAADQLDAAAALVVDAIHGDLERNEACGARTLNAAAEACGGLLVAHALHVADPGSDAEGSTRDDSVESLLADFGTAWREGTSGDCAADAEDAVRDALVEAAESLVESTIVAVELDDGAFTTLSPTGTTSYMGKELTPVCMDGSPYHFFAKRGTVNKLVMYYQGGGACWEDLTCSLPVCDTTVDPEGGDNPNNATTGFADRTNPDNPFRDWHQVFVSYCSCDVHFGDAAQDYPTHVEHRGFHNSKYAEKWAREHFLAPEVVFVTGSSAGSYGALFNGALLHNVWPAAQFHVLGDAGNGVITPQFLNNELSNWNFIANLPDDVPGVLEALEGEGMPAYLHAVATHFPKTNWANYSTMYDGGLGGQTGFYNVMLNGNDPLAAVTWWEGSCAFASQMRAQAVDVFGLAGDNYRYYIGTGSRHTMWGNDKVYDDTTGGVPTIVDWTNAMLRSTPAARDPEWTNVECENCGLILDGDPVPEPLAAPFEQQGSDVVVVCP